MTISATQIKELREATGAGILDCRDALTASEGDFEKALEYLREKGLAKAAKRGDREASEGVVELYNHGNGRVGVMLELNCETDFVGNSEGFRTLAHELALQVAASSPLFVSEEDIPQEALDAEVKEVTDKAIEDGKPESILPKIVEGRLKKYKDEVCLLNQQYIRDDGITIQDMINQNVAVMGEQIIIRRFSRWEIGELSNLEESEEE
jgi:elongation factor Ts